MYCKESLCWTCQNAVPNKENGCSWSINFKPVKGWDAIRQDVMHNGGKERWTRPLESYKVRKCPCYKEDSAVS